MATKATKTIKQALSYKPQHAAWFEQTQVLFNCVVAFYFDVIQAHQGVLELSSMEALGALERLTHTTEQNPHPVMPLSAAAPDLPARMRRAAINAALGQAKSFYTHLAKWHKCKEEAEAKKKKYTIRPPVPPRTWNRSVVCYAGMWRPCEGSSIMLKLWTGSSWAWIKVGTCGRHLPKGWESLSPQLVQHGQHWYIHIPIEQELVRPKKVEEQVKNIPQTRICSVDLNINEHLAVCTIQTAEGTVVATRFIGGGKQLHGLRKKQLGRIAVNRNKTGIIAKDEQDNKHLWAKVRDLNEDAAHQVSHRIVAFAKKHGASILVFEHLANFKPEKGRYSKQGNEKRSYWLRGKIFKYARYKAWNEGIITSRVNPRHTSRDCARCGAKVARYDADKPAEGYTTGAPLAYCPNCQMRGNADRNAALNIGKRLLARYQQTTFKEKPQQAPLRRARRSVKTEGVTRSQDAKCAGWPSTQGARHGSSNAQGTAQAAISRMGENAAPTPRQLRLFNE